jgi:hypothetical protein
MASEPSYEIKPLWHALLIMWLPDEALSQTSVIRSALTSSVDENVRYQFAVNDLQEQVTLSGTAGASDHPPNVVIADELKFIDHSRSPFAILSKVNL